MKKIWTTLSLLFIFLLAACGGPDIEDPITLKNHNNEDVVIPGDKPTLLFFITTYT